MSSRTGTPRLGLLVTFGLMTGPFLSMLDSNIVNVAVPTIAKDFGTSLTVVQWTLSGYLLAQAGALALSPFLAKRFGTKPVYMASVAAFTTASVLCATSKSIEFLIAARVLQGFAGAPLVPLAMSMMMGPSGASRQMSPAAAILLFMAPAAGPTVGGLLIPAFGWQSIFLINVPFGVAGIMGALQLDERLAHPPQEGARLDWGGLSLLSVGLVFTLYGVSEGPRVGWSSGQSWPFSTIGIAAVVAYVGWALRRRHPAVDLKLVMKPQPALAVALSVMTSAVLFSALFLVPVFMQTLQGATPLEAGLALLPQGLMLGIATIAGNAIAQRVSTRLVVFVGMVLLTAMTAGLLLLDLHTPSWQTALILSGRGVAMGLVITPLVFNTMSRVPAAESADANTLFNVVQRLGGSFGIALLATFLQAREVAHISAVLQPLGISPASLGSASATAANIPPGLRQALGDAAVAGFHDTFLVLTVISALGALLALLIRDSRTTSESSDATSRQPAILLGRE
jgi:EmrB/QacA subfamily drug resistance transporter